MNDNLWTIMYRIVANKLKTGNIMSTIKKADGTMTTDWRNCGRNNKRLISRGQRGGNGRQTAYKEESAVEIHEIKRHIETLKPKKAPGPDGIKAEIYQKTFNITAPLLTQIINDCFKKGYFPAQHKKAELSLIYKDGDKDPQDIKSYRSIYLLNIQEKIIEKVIHTRLNNYLEEQEKSHPKQYSYKKRRSIVDTISHNKIKTKETTYVLGLFVDFSSTFDRISWTRLFSLLRDLQISPDIYNLLRSYFQDREVLIRTPECIARKRINGGCPQGSILRPILWNTHLNNLLGLLDKEESITDFAAYADHLCILIGGNSRRIETRNGTRNKGKYSSKNHL